MASGDTTIKHPCYAFEGRVHVRPQESDELLINPMMGFQTYQRFNGDPTEPENHWDDDGPTSYRKYSGKLANEAFPDTSVAYLRWYWARLEPEKRAYRWDIIDRALEEADQRHQQLHIRVMPHDSFDLVPEWYKREGRLIRFDTKSKPGCIPDYSDPLFQESTERLIGLLGERYANDPRLCALDIGTLGFWGEWHNCSVPGRPLMDEKGRQWAVDLYLRAFPAKPLMMLIGSIDALGYATSKGAGWRADCWGDMSAGGTGWTDYVKLGEPAWNHMQQRYPFNLYRSHSADAWKKAPVCQEACWTFVFWHKNNWSVDYILDEALRWHTSLINAKSSRIPEEWREKVDAFQKKLGYRFVLRALHYPVEVSPGAKFNIEQWWINRGVAPCYQDYRLLLRFQGPSRSIDFELPHEMRTWLPEDDQCPQDDLSLPNDFPEGSYEVRIGIVRPGDRKPAVKMANAGRDADGWLRLGEIAVRRQK
jgi:hypothetical protein